MTQEKMDADIRTLTKILNSPLMFNKFPNIDEVMVTTSFPEHNYANFQVLISVKDNDKTHDLGQIDNILNIEDWVYTLKKLS